MIEYKFTHQDIEALTNSIIEKLKERYSLVEIDHNNIERDHDAIIEKATDYACKIYEVSRNELRLKSSRSAHFCRAREMVFFLLKKHFPSISFKKMAKYFNRNHATAMSGLKNVYGWVEISKEIKRQMEEHSVKFKNEYDFEKNKPVN